MSTSYTSRLGTAPEEGVKAPCVVSTTADITLSGEQTINTVAVTAGDRVLVRSQTDNTENGIYDCAVGAWTRSTDFNDETDVIAGQLVADSHTGAIYKTSFSGDYDPGTTALTLAVALTVNAAGTSFTPAGNIAATDVQTAIEEVDSETVRLTGNQTIAGQKTFSTPVDLTKNGTCFITLNSDEDGAPSENAGITVERGTSDDAYISFDESGDKVWKVGTGVNIHAIVDAGTDQTIAGDKLFTGNVDVGDYGTESSGVNINGVVYSYRERVSDIGGSTPAEVIFHRHSTTLQPLLLTARSNSNDNSHVAVTTGQALFSTVVSGYTVGHYDLFGETRFSVGTGTVSGTSSPGKWELLLSPDGSNTPAAVITADSDKSVAFPGAVTVSSTVNGRDIATDGSKLDGIEALADVTDAANVNAAGAVMESDTTTASMSFVVDEDDMTSDLATKVPTQQSVKAYVDDSIQGSAVSGFTLGGTVRLAADFSSASFLTYLDMTTVSSTATYETYGPTGSGADNIYTAMDDIPAGAKGVILSTFVYAQASAAGFCKIIAQARPNGNTEGTALDMIILGTASGYLASSGQYVQSSGYCVVPLDPNNIFDAKWETLGSLSGQISSIAVAGWIK